MATKAFNLEELETVCRTIVVGSRSDRLRAMNIFRGANSKAAVDYLVNAFIPSRAAYDTAVTNFSGDVSNAVGSAVTGENTELETIFTYLLAAGRSDRLTILNIIRVELGDDPVDYLVNVFVPSTTARDAAYAAVEADAEA